jgi:X-Pro dipeptidyl-peptidase
VRPSAAACVAAALVTVLGSSVTPLSAQVATPEQCGGDSGGNSKVSDPGPYDIGETKAVELASDMDGGIIQVGVIRPDVPAGTKVPVIVDAGPYFWADLTETDLATCNAFLVENFVPHGYAVAFVPTRGAGGTNRCSDLMGDNERGDLDQAITWLGEQPWSNGRVGMSGLSYDGSTPWEVASTGNPYLRTIVPASGVTDLYSLLYRSGRADSRWWLFVPGYQTLYNTIYANPSNGRDPMAWAEAALCEGVVEGMAASVQSYVTGEDDAFGYWAERNSRPGTEKRYRGSVFLVQGLQDRNVIAGQSLPWVNKLKRKGTYVKMMLGQWRHAWPDTGGNAESVMRWDYADILLRWWERWLKDDDGVDTGPRVEVQDSTGRWRVERSWPPDDAVDRGFFLGAETALRGTVDAEETRTTLGPGSRSRYVFIAEPIEQSESPADQYCVACAVFTSQRQAEDLHIAGIPSLDLTVVPHGPGGTISAYLYRVGQDGTYDLLGYGSADLRFPDGGHNAHPVAPGEEMSLRFDLEPLDAVVGAGERLVLALEQGNTNDMPGPLAFPVDLVHGGKRSSFRFPTVTPDPTSFFTPPPEP